MTDTLEGTTMEDIAFQLWMYFGGPGTWADSSDAVKQHYRQAAVRIIDRAEPVWRRRVGAEVGAAWDRGHEEGRTHHLDNSCRGNPWRREDNDGN